MARSKAVCRKCGAINLLPAGTKDLKSVRCGSSDCGGELRESSRSDPIRKIVTHATKEVLQVPPARTPDQKVRGINRSPDGQGLLFKSSPPNPAPGIQE